MHTESDGVHQWFFFKAGASRWRPDCVHNSDITGVYCWGVTAGIWCDRWLWICLLFPTDQEIPKAQQRFLQSRFFLFSVEFGTTERQRLTSTSTSTPSSKMPKIMFSTSESGEWSIFSTPAMARRAVASELCCWRYCESNISNEIESGIRLLSELTKTGPIGAGGGWGNLGTCSLMSIIRTWRSGWSGSMAEAWLSALMACRSFPLIEMRLYGKKTGSRERRTDHVWWQHRRMLSRHL